MVTINKIEKGVAEYLDNELMPKLPSSGIEKVIVGTAMSLGIRKYGAIIEGYKDNKMVQTLGIMNNEGLVDIDILAEEFKKNMPSEGLKVEVPMLGELKFNKEDVDKLYRYITE